MKDFFAYIFMLIIFVTPMLALLYFLEKSFKNWVDDKLKKIQSFHKYYESEILQRNVSIEDDMLNVNFSIAPALVRRVKWYIKNRKKYKLSANEKSRLLKYCKVYKKLPRKNRIKFEEKFLDLQFQIQYNFITKTYEKKRIELIINALYTALTYKSKCNKDLVFNQIFIISEEDADKYKDNGSIYLPVELFSNIETSRSEILQTIINTWIEEVLLSKGNCAEEFEKKLDEINSYIKTNESETMPKLLTQFVLNHNEFSTNHNELNTLFTQLLQGEN